MIDNQVKFFLKLFSLEYYASSFGIIRVFFVIFCIKYLVVWNKFSTFKRR